MDSVKYIVIERADAYLTDASATFVDVLRGELFVK